MLLLSVYTDPAMVQAWRAGVKAMKITQGQAIQEALHDWLVKHERDIQTALHPQSRPALRVARVVGDDTGPKAA